MHVLCNLVNLRVVLEEVFSLKGNKITQNDIALYE